MNKTRQAKHLPPVFRWSFLSPRYWPTWIGCGLLFLIAQLPIRFNVALGKGLGFLLFHLAPSRRRITDTNIRLCFPELDLQERNKLVRRIIDNCAIGFFETSMAWWGPARNLRNCYRIKGKEHLLAAQAAGKGVLLVGLHMTTLDLGGRLLAFETKSDMVYRQPPNQLLAYLMTSAREFHNGEAIISVETRKLVRNLRAGHIVWYAPDQDYGIKHSVFAPFFGIPAATVPGTGRFAALGNAQVMFYSHYRQIDGSYLLEISPPLESFSTGDDVADCTRVNQMLEKMIRKQPDQYLWVHRRFKTRPEGEPDIYPKKKK